LLYKFHYNKGADVYVCPAGQQFSFRFCLFQDGMNRRVYKCYKGVCLACQFCGTKCTSNKNGRVIFRWENEGIIYDMKKRMKSHPETMGERKIGGLAYVWNFEEGF
jgi:hypothetical protein